MIARRGPFASVQVNIDALGQNIVGDAANEPSIAIDPTDPSKMAIGWRQFDTIADSFRQAGLSYSTDGGASWTFPGVLDPGQFRSDPVLGSDASGNFYYSSLSTLTSIEMFKSVDGGATWGVPVPAFGGDKQWIAIDDTAGIGSGNVYQIWNVQFTCCGNSDFTRSINGGASFEGPFAIPQPSMKWGTMDVGPDGTLYLAGTTLNQTGHIFSRSTNARNPAQVPVFDLVQNVNLAGTVNFATGPNPAGLLGQTWIATDHSAGPTAGNLYILQSVNPPGPDPLDIHFIRSEDNGQTWSAPVRVNDDPIGNNAWQWFGTMSVAPNGRIDVVWNDTRNTGQDNLSELFYSFSNDGGLTWTANIPVSPLFDSHLGWPQQNKMGDYFDMISDDDGANLAWAATFNGEQDVYFLHIDSDCNDNGAVDVCDVDCGVAGCGPPCGGSSDCNANSVPDECEPDCNGDGLLDECEIAAGAEDCQPNGVPDSCDLDSGDSQDLNINDIPDECECVVGAAPLADLTGDQAITKNRILSFRVLEFSRRAVRVIFDELPAPFDIWNGSVLWVGEPTEVTEVGSLIEPVPGFDNFNAAVLRSSNFMMTGWSELGVVHVIHEGFVPGGRYIVQTIQDGCVSFSEENFSPPLIVTMAKWGDTMKDFTTDPAGPPDGTVNIVDIFAIVGRFRTAPGSISKTRTDLEPGCLDLVENITDVLSAVSAFQGLPYPFTPTAATAAASTCESPLPKMPSGAADG